MTAQPTYRCLVEHYEACLDVHGVNHRGVDWPDEKGMALRFEVMLGLLQAPPPHARLLDLGCGPGLLLDHIAQRGPGTAIAYSGIDLSPKMIVAAEARHPHADFSVRDLLKEPLAPRSFDYVVMNGLLTEKRALSQAQMVDFTQRMICAAFEAAAIGVAFNVMSSHVDWTRDDLFHWPADELLAFAVKHLTRHVVLRADYGLYEYTAYLYRAPNGAREDNRHA
ncbi:MAG: class I SAM-dependent methyltransferase [Kiloniellales bacterium]